VGKRPNLNSPAVKTLKQKIPEVQKRIRLALQVGQTTASIDQLYRQLKDLRTQLHAKTKQHEDQQLHQYLNQGQLNFTLCGPTLKGAWRFF
jgi:ribosome-interacting GTPase 1